MNTKTAHSFPTWKGLCIMYSSLSVTLTAVAGILMALLYGLGYEAGYEDGKRLGALEILATEGCMTDYECSFASGEEEY